MRETELEYFEPMHHPKAIVVYPVSGRNFHVWLTEGLVSLLGVMAFDVNLPHIIVNRIGPHVPNRRLRVLRLPSGHMPIIPNREDVCYPNASAIGPETVGVS